MKQVLIAAILITAIVVASGCIEFAENANKSAGAEEQVQQNITPEENITIVKEAVEQKPALANKIYVGPGRSSALAEYNGTLFIAYQRYRGATEDIYYANYNGKSVSGQQKLISTELNDITPSLNIFGSKLYLFYTKSATGIELSSDIYFEAYDSTKWGAEQKANDFDTIRYPHGQSAIAYNNKLLLFWTKGRPGEIGKIGTQYFDGKDFWGDGIIVSAENVNEKNPKVSATGNMIDMIYEGYAPNAESNHVYYRNYDGTRWSGAERISNESNANFKETGGIIRFNGKIYALWFAGGNLYLSIKEGSSWGETIKLSTGSQQQEEPTIAEYNGKLYVSYTQIEESGTPFVYLAELKV